MSNIANFVKGSLITCFAINSKWVTLHIWWKAVSSHLLLWPTVCEWHCMFWKGNLFYDKQDVSDILHILGKVVSSHLLLWPTVCEWHCIFCERQSPHLFLWPTVGEWHIARFVKGSLIRSFPMTNRKWVTLHILWKAVSSHLFLWPIGSEWHCSLWKAVSSDLFQWPIGSKWYCTYC